jgi:hypothetical protein
MKDPIRLERFQRWTRLFSDRPGESVLTELKKMCGQDNTSAVQSVVDGKIDPYYTMLKEGRRSVWIDIEAILKEPPEIPEEVNEESS